MRRKNQINYEIQGEDSFTFTAHTGPRCHVSICLWDHLKDSFCIELTHKKALDLHRGLGKIIQEWEEKKEERSVPYADDTL